MPSSYTTSLRLTLPATGELAGQWGNTVNTGITELLDAAVAGTASISTWGGAGVAYTLSNNSGTADEARKMFIVATGSPGEAKNVICPAVSKFYVFRNDTTGGFALTLKTSGGTGIAVPAGQYKFLYCDGTNVVEMFNSVASLRLSSLTSGRVTYAGTAGLLQDSANFTFNGTDLTVSGAVNAGSVNATTLDLTNLEVTNIKAKDGTASASIADSTGVMSLVANPVFSGGTANGVLYLNGSNVATSGTALAFNGTSLLVGKNSSDANNWGVQNYATNAFGSGMQLTYGGVGSAGLWVPAASSLAFGADAGSGTTELMRLTSTGLGIGTSSPDGPLQVSFSNAETSQFNAGAATLYLTNTNTTNNNWAQIFFTDSDGGAAAATFGAQYTDHANDYAALSFATRGASGLSERMRLDSSGNLGIGTSSPSYKLDISAPNDSTARVRLLTTTGYNILWSSNNSGGTWVGTEGSAGGALMSGTPAWASVITSTVAAPLCFGINTTEQMRLDSSGNLGIGTSSPNFKLDATASGATVANFNRTTSSGSTVAVQVAGSTVGTLGSDTGGNGRFDISSVSGGASANTIQFSRSGGTLSMLLDSSGNLGLGVTPSAVNPSGYKTLNIGGAGFSLIGNGTDNHLTSNAYYDNNVAAWKYALSTTAARYNVQNGTHIWFTAPSGTAGNAISFTQAMTLDASGNLQVGTSSGTFINGKGIVIADATAARLKLADTDAGVGTSNGLELGFGGAIGSIYNLENGALLLGTNNTERARITSGGDLLVGNTASVQSSRAEFTSTSLAPAFLARVNVDADESQWAGQFQKKTNTNTTSQIFVRFLINDGATASGYITANGANAATFTSSSDARLKENICDLPSQLASIQSLRPVEFDFKDGSGHQIGFIAQELQTVYPDCVSEGADGMLQIGGWSKTEARLVKAIQEQQALITALTARVAALEKP